MEKTTEVESAEVGVTTVFYFVMLFSRTTLTSALAIKSKFSPVKVIDPELLKVEVEEMEEIFGLVA